MRIASSSRTQSGFTLLELMVIVAIIGIMVGLGYAGLATLKAGYDVSGATNELYADLQWAKQKSLGSGNSYGIDIDASNDSYEVYQINGTCDSGAATSQLREKDDFELVDIQSNAAMDICFSKRGTTDDWTTITLSCKDNACDKQNQINISQFNVVLQ